MSTRLKRPGLGRIPVLDLAPEVDCGTWPAKAFDGEVIEVSATAFREGHGLIGVEAMLTDPDGHRHVHRMRPVDPGWDRWSVRVRLDGTGMWSYAVRAYADEYATWLHDARLKIPAGVDLELTLAAGAALLRRLGEDAGLRDAERQVIATTLEALQDSARPAQHRLDAAEHRSVVEIADGHPILDTVSTSAERRILVERERAGVGSWYEFFPRSVGAKRAADGSWTSGTFRTAAERLPAIADMGFDVVYLPPIHPIGTAFRKGPNNALTAGEHDPGSPWAIGSPDGGHDAIHPDLGTEADFAAFCARARESGLEVALDLALQASPDHPWVSGHPEWFTRLPDGSIAYAENPPKKYQDIYPVNFDGDPAGIRRECLRIVERWIEAGIRIFRVDNPHTKPLDFWEWLLSTVRERHPDVVFLAEAFTRPAVLRTLAKIGFQQSYTYFTWRNSKEELTEFLASISAETAAYLRPNLFVNTPDILTEYLQFGGPPAFKIRAAVAALAAPTWGVYSGFELHENVARPGSEEYIDNEKYQYRPRDFDVEDSLAPYLRMLNRARAEHPALRQLRNLRLVASDDPAVLAFVKHLDASETPDERADTVIAVINLDPHTVRESMVHLDLPALGLDPGFEVEDRVTGSVWRWGADNYVRLDPFTEPAHILRVRRAA